jgi:tRNA dimethylallyltransferase
MQVYRGMDIGTAKPSVETRRRIPHHMVDIADPAEEINVQRFQELARQAIADAHARGRKVVIAGGSGLHFRAIVDPMTFAPTDPAVRRRLEEDEPGILRRRLLEADPDAAEHLDVANPRRVVRALEILELTGETPSARSASAESGAVGRYEALFPFRAFGIDPGAGVAERIEERFRSMVAHGLLEEVAGLRGRLGVTAAQAVGYKELLPVVRGEAVLDDGVDQAIRATRGLVKRQRTFFRRDPRIAWLPWQDDDARRIADAVETIGERAAWTS